MAEFRKCAPDTSLAVFYTLKHSNPILQRALDQALQPWLAQRREPLRLAVGLSGGVDSAVLAVYTHYWAQQHLVDLHFFHIHHGLQAIADQWQQHVHALAQGLQRPCHSLRVSVDSTRFRADGMESAARQARYAGFARLAEQVLVEDILLAHHQDDQAETVLMRLLRGAGPEGLGAMLPCVKRDKLTLWRPWLDVPRRLLVQAGEEFSKENGWHAVQDPTNLNPDYTRGAVRERLSPILNVRWPGWQAALARQARLSQEHAKVLQEVARSDFETLLPDAQGSFCLKAWRELGPERQALVLRYWLNEHGLRMPTEARLRDLMRQLRELHALGHDRQLQLKHGNTWIMCRKGRVFIQSIPAQA